MSATLDHQGKALFFPPSWDVDEHGVVIPPDRELLPEIAERVADDQLLLFAKRLISSAKNNRYRERHKRLTAVRIELAMLVLERAQP